MIRFDRVTVTYPDATEPTLREVDLVVPEAELCLVVGGTGSGKSTLLRAVNGLVPRFTGGSLAGRVTVDGFDTADVPPRELAAVVGFVGQDPRAGFVTDVVEDELAYGMENLGLAPDAMRRRVEDTLDLLGLADLRQRPLQALSGGQQQRVAIGAVLAAGPRVLVLDEPTSALDPAAAEEVLAALTRLVHDLGLTVLVAEHRLERVVQYADTMVWVPGGGAAVVHGSPDDVLALTTGVPPVVALGRALGWQPVPRSVRDARRAAGPLRERLAGTGPPPDEPASERRRAPGPVLARVRGLDAAYGPVPALRAVDLELRAGEVVALMGRNGSGKSTLLAHLAGLRSAAGAVEVGGDDPHALHPQQALRRVALVPQDAGVLLYNQTVAAECETGDRDAGAPPGTTAARLAALLGPLDHATHPGDLSEGQRLGLALAVVLAGEAPLVLLDEPTRGLDYDAKHRLVATIRQLAAAGRGVVLATHDVEVVAQVADRAVVLAEGEVVADGPAREVVCHSPVFAPQVAKVVAPAPWLTVDEVTTALAGAAP